MRARLLVLMATLWATGARAADLSVSLHDFKGKPVRDAVVALYPATGAEAGPVRFDWSYRMAQQNLQFDPFVLLVPVGAAVAFPNRDSVRHQVYSFSPTHPFELKLYGKDDTRSVRFDKVGVIALGCNIHDSMVAFIKVVDTPFAAKTDATGAALLHGAPAGAARLEVWHPYLKAPGNTLVRSLNLPRDGAVRDAETAEVRTPPMRRTAY